jgi:hypothetical protein
MRRAAGDALSLETCMEKEMNLRPEYTLYDRLKVND